MKIKFAINYGLKSLFFCRTYLESGAPFFILFIFEEYYSQLIG